MRQNRPTKIIILSLAALAVFLFTGPATQAYFEDADVHPDGEYVPGEVLVKLKDGARLEFILQELRLKPEDIARVHSRNPVVTRFKKDYKLEKDSDGWYWFLGKQYSAIEDIPEDLIFDEAYKNLSPHEQALYRTYKITLPPETSVEDAIYILENNTDVEFIEPNYLGRILYTPTNDPLYHNQWAHQKTQAQDGWDIERGETSVIVAVADTGVYYGHTDLAANIWTDASGYPGRDYVDINTQAYVNDGYILIASEDYTNIDHDPSDYTGHGTHCAGIIAAVEGNSAGVVGVTHHCRIMPVRCGFSIIDPYYGEVGMLEYDDIALAVRYAADNGADIISMSFGGPSSSTVKNALDYAYYDRGVLLVASAGNSNSSSRSYPAGHSNVIAVAATAEDDTKAYYSNYGSWVDIAAPGGDHYKDTKILSTVPTWGTLGHPSGYAYLQGTSMSCPYVSGLAALIMSRYPSYTLNEVATCIYDGADDISSSGMGAGRVNVYNSLSSGSPPDLVAEIDDPQNDSEVIQSVSVVGTATSNNFTHYTVEIGQGDSPISWSTRGVSLTNDGLDPVTDGVLATCDFSSYADGTHTIKLEAFDTSGFSVEDRVTVITLPAMQAGWPQDIPSREVNDSGEGSIIFADVSSNGNLDIVATTERGFIYVWNRSGVLLSGWPVDIGVGAQTAAVGDIDGNGDVEIVVGAFNSEPSLFVFNHNGSSFAGDWPKDSSDGVVNIRNAPTLADIDADGDLEIIVANYSWELCAWHHDGTPVAGWPVSVNNSQYVTDAAVADIDVDGELEIIAADGNTSTGSVYAWNADGSAVTGSWPVDVVGGVRHAPVVGDIDGDGSPEIIVSARGGLYAFRGDGSLVSGSWPKISVGYGDLALADFNGDGAHEIVMAANAGVDEPRYVRIFSGDGSDFGNWPYNLNLPDTVSVFGPSVANADDDQEQEIIVFAGRYSSPHVHPMLYIFNSDASLLSGYPKYFLIEPYATPALGDLDGDGDVEMGVCAERSATSGTPTPLYVFDLAGDFFNRRMDWPVLGQNPQHTHSMGSFLKRPPVLSSIGNKSVNEGELLEFIVTATDADGDQLWFDRPTFNELPLGASFLDNRDGTARFRWQPVTTQAGTYPLTFSVTDGDFFDSEDIIITVTSPIDPPDAPSHLVAEARSETRIRLDWRDNSDDEEGFKIERKTEGGSFIQIDTVDANATSYVDRGLSATETYTYRVRAYNEVGDSSYSNEATASPQTVPPPRIQRRTPSSGRRNTTVTLRGKDFGPKDSSCKVQFKGRQTKYARIISWSNKTIKCKVPRLKKGKYRIRVINANGTSNAKIFRVK
jgi:subtilisin family serine protease